MEEKAVTDEDRWLWFQIHRNIWEARRNKDCPYCGVMINDLIDDNCIVGKLNILLHVQIHLVRMDMEVRMKELAP